MRRPTWLTSVGACAPICEMTPRRPVACRRTSWPPLAPPTALQPGETVAFNVVEGVFFLSFMSALLRDTWVVGRKASAQEWAVALGWLAMGALLIAASITLVAFNFRIWST